MTTEYYAAPGNLGKSHERLLIPSTFDGANLCQVKTFVYWTIPDKCSCSCQDFPGAGKRIRDLPGMIRETSRRTHMLRMSNALHHDIYLEICFNTLSLSGIEDKYL
jgi:hypothetical protein